MPIQAEVYTSFSEISITLGHRYSPEQQKSAACDRLLNLIYDEALVHASPQTQLQRLQALVKYHGVKRAMEQAWFVFAGAETRKVIRDFTYNNALIEFNEGQVGRCGRYHRALMSVINESAGYSDKQAAVQIWLNNTITAIGQDFNYLVPPFVAEVSAYRIDAGPSIENTGATINLSEGQRIDMYTTGVNFGSSEWEVNAVPIPTETEESMRISSVVIADTGAYINQFTNVSGTTPSDTFNIVVT